MHFKFFQVLSAVFIINSTLVANEKPVHDNCFKYDMKTSDGTKARDKYIECGGTDAKTAETVEVMKCVASNYQIVKKDGTINRGKQIAAIKKFTYPEYMDKTLKLAEKCTDQTVEKCFTILAKGLPLICPKDEFHGIP